MVECDVCGEESLIIHRYWKAGKIDNQEGLLITVCDNCDNPVELLDDKGSKKAITKGLRDYVKLQVVE